MDTFARIKPGSHVHANWDHNKFTTMNLAGTMFRREANGTYRAGPLTTEQLSVLQVHPCVTIEVATEGVPDDPVTLTKGEIAEAAAEQREEDPAPASAAPAKPKWTPPPSAKRK